MGKHEKEVPLVEVEFMSRVSSLKQPQTEDTQKLGD